LPVFANNFKNGETLLMNFWLEKLSTENKVINLPVILAKWQ
jgi:hypothetical protein